MTDSVTQNTAAGTTTATYTITQPSGAPEISLINAAIQSCHVGQINTISDDGAVETGADPDTALPGPSIRWPDDEGDDNQQGDNENEGNHNDGDENEGNQGDQDEGNQGDENEGNENDGDENEGNEGDENEGPETITVSYTVAGLFAPTDEQIAIKGGGNVVTGTVQGVGCNPATTSAGPGTPVSIHGVPVTCADRRKFRFRLHHARRARIVDVNVFVNGKRKVHKHGRNIRSVTLKRLPLGTFTVTVVARQNTGSSITSTRRYKGCKKSRPRSRSHHHRRH